MTESIVRVGTAGWSYEDWEGIVYPRHPQRGFDRLAAMAALFDANEINSTFYRIPDARQTADWARRAGAVNERFRFTAKLFRGFTHEKEPGPEDAKAFREAMRPLAAAGRLGAVLVQFPYSFHATNPNRTRLVSILERFPELPLAVEFRHDSWNTDDNAQLLSEREAAFVNIDQPDLAGNLPPTNRVTSAIAYYRFHGRNGPKWFGPDTSNVERYNYLYSDGELAPWIERIRDGARRAAERAAASSREGGAYAILNNHFRGQAVANALELQLALTGQRRPAPDSMFETYPALARVADRARGGAQRRLF